eukprot:COSAG02_NODE_14113_length_1308_cov_1.994210_1_plen_412_part_00
MGCGASKAVAGDEWATNTAVVPAAPVIPAVPMQPEKTGTSHDVAGDQQAPATIELRYVGVASTPPSEAPRRISLTSLPLIIGRKEGPGMVKVTGPEHAAISRRHVAIARRRDGELGVTDLGSRNASFLDGVQLERDTEYWFPIGGVLALGAPGVVEYELCDVGDPDGTAVPASLFVTVPPGMTAGAIMQVDVSDGTGETCEYFTAVPADMKPGSQFHTIIGGGAHASLKELDTLQPLVANLVDMGYDRLASEAAIARVPGCGRSKLVAAVDLLLRGDVFLLSSMRGDDFFEQVDEDVQNARLLELATSVADRQSATITAEVLNPGSMFEGNETYDPLSGIGATERVVVALNCARSSAAPKEEIAQILALVVARGEEVHNSIAQQRTDQEQPRHLTLIFCTALCHSILPSTF